ncbi:MAG: bacillithiol biosynthesis deacetylase BshB1 [Bacteroidetes bacterium]|nr:bacillithiol biosynthesis deacetylase BshB1 [Bacteroidota bacterium]
MKLDILAFAAHPDDVEISAAGTLLKYISEGKSAGIIDLTEGELGTRGTVQTRYEEAEAAAKLLGISARENLRIKDGFFEHTEENKRLIIKQIRRFQPEIVLANSILDRHPDHGRAAKLVADACHLAGLRKIETEWEEKPQEAFRPRLVLHYIQDYYIQPNFVVDVSEFMDKKIEVIKAYKTQFYNPNSTEPSTPISGEEFFDFLKGRMMSIGRPAGMKYAEGFTIDRIVGVKDLFDLK